eukprot:2506639-Pleurochrysis_carterae.AAC.1
MRAPSRQQFGWSRLSGTRTVVAWSHLTTRLSPTTSIISNGFDDDLALASLLFWALELFAAGCSTAVATAAGALLRRGMADAIA